MKNQKFKLCDKKIYIYGFDAPGRKIEKTLSDSGLFVQGFIDRRADEINNSNILTIESFINITSFCRNSVAVIICFRNGLEHVKCAENLLQNRIINVVFLPLIDDGLNIYSRMMLCFYTTLSYANIIDIRKELPTLDLIFNNKFDFSRNVLLEIGEFIVVRIPVECIHIAEFRETVDYSKRIVSRNIELGGGGLDFLPGVELYNYIFNDGAEPENYLDYFTYNKTFKEQLESRVQLFKFFYKKIKSEPDFFDYIPIKVNLNANGKWFNIVDGHHRAIFLANYGLTYLPCISKKTEWMEFFANVFHK